MDIKCYKKVLLLMITKDIIPIFNIDTFLEGIKSDSNVSMYEIESPEYNSCGPFPPTPCAVHTAPNCASSGGPFFIGSLFVIMMYLRGYLVISEAT